jgi:hypothetical protein
MSLRRGKHAPQHPHRWLIRAGISGAGGYRCSGGER